MNILASVRRMTAIADKEWIHIRRDSRSLALSLLVPSFLVLLFGYALNVDVRNIPIGILDHDNSAMSRGYRDSISHTEYLLPTRTIASVGEIDELIETGTITMALVIPAGFETRLKLGKASPIQLIVDGSDSTSAIISLGYMKAITYLFQRSMASHELKKMGIASVLMPVEVSPRVWYNSEMKSKNFIIPGLIVLILAIISALITSLAISREWERGTMETLITTPVRSHEIVLGKLIPYLVIGMFNVIMAMIIGYFVFDVPFRGSTLLLCGISLLFLTGTSGLGIFISAATRVQVLSIQFAIVVTYMPSLILSDFIFPSQNMPLIIQGISYIIPAKYLIYILKAIALKGLGFSLIIMPVAFLSIFTVIVLALTIARFKVMLPNR